MNKREFSKRSVDKRNLKNRNNVETLCLGKHVRRVRIGSFFTEKTEENDKTLKLNIRLQIRAKVQQVRRSHSLDKVSEKKNSRTDR